MSGSAWAENAVIVSDNGKTVRFRRQCPYCGKTDTTYTDEASVGGSSNMTRSCRYCGKIIKITISRN